MTCSSDYIVDNVITRFRYHVTIFRQKICDIRHMNRQHQMVTQIFANTHVSVIN